MRKTKTTTMSSAFDEVVFRLVDHIAAERRQSFAASKLKAPEEGRERAKQLGNSDEGKDNDHVGENCGQEEDEDESGYVAPGSTRLGLRTKQTRGRYTGRF